MLSKFSLQSPTLTSNDDKLNYLLDALTPRVNTAKQHGTPSSQRQYLSLETLIGPNGGSGQTPKQSSAELDCQQAKSLMPPPWKSSNDDEARPSMRPPTTTSKNLGTPQSAHWPPASLQSTPRQKQQDELPASSSPTLSVKHAPKAPLEDIAQYPQLPPPKFKAWNPTAAEKPSAANTSFGTTSANTSFTTTTSANTSLWSEPPQCSQEVPLPQATSIASLDGADDDPDLGCTQTTYYGSSPSCDQSSVQQAVSPQRNDKSTQTDQTDYGSTIPDADLVESEPKRKDSGLLQQTRKSDAGSSGTESTVTATKAASEATDKARTTPTKKEQKNVLDSKPSPAKEDLNKHEHLRVRRIPADGLLDDAFYSDAIADMPFYYRYECARVLQACNIPVEKLRLSTWPKSFEELHEIALDLNPAFQPCSEAAYENGSLSVNIAWTESKGKATSLLASQVLAPQNLRLNSWQRKYGADRFLFVDCVSFSKPPTRFGLINQQEHIKRRFQDMLAAPQKFLGRTWLQFHAEQKKSNKKGDFPQSGAMKYIFVALNSDNGSLSPLYLRDVVGWALPFASNLDKPLGKMYARLDLRASRTVDVLSLKPEEIQFGNDTLATMDAAASEFNDPALASQFPENEKYKENTVMNDGCSLAQPYLFKKVEQAFRRTNMPSLAQFRCAGAKGIVSRQRIDGPYDPDKQPSGPLLHINPSQLKVQPINRDLRNHDEHYLSFDVVTINYEVKEAVLYHDFLAPMIERHVPPEAIVEIATRSARAEADEFIQALEDPKIIRDWIRKQNASMEDRRREFDMATLCGFPRSTMEKAILMIESGFEAKKFEPLAELIKKEVEGIFDHKMKNFRIALPRSANIIGIADPSGTLEPGEIYIAFSKGVMDPVVTSMECFHLECNVLAGRNPASRSSDLQKVRAVYKKELNHLKDVVVFSAKGPRPLADKLSGGDYDGDIFWICWEQLLVEPFKNAPAPQSLPEPRSFGIEIDEKKLGDIVKDPESEDQVRRFVQICTANRMKPNLLGQVTVTLSRVIHEKGMRHPVSVDLMFLKDFVIDADKTGHTFTNEAFTRFKKQRNIMSLKAPAYFKYTKPTEEDSYMDVDTNNITDKVFFDVLQKIFNEAKKKGADLLKGAETRDTDVTATYHRFSVEANNNAIIQMELKHLKQGFAALNETWKIQISRIQNKNVDWENAMLVCRKEYDSIQPLNPHNSSVKEWTRQIANEMTLWDRLKASTLAKFYHTGKMWLHIALKEVCLLKVQASMHTRTMTVQQYNNLVPVNPKKRKAKALVNGEAARTGEEAEFDLEAGDFASDEVALGAEL